MRDGCDAPSPDEDGASWAPCCSAGQEMRNHDSERSTIRLQPTAAGAMINRGD